MTPDLARELREAAQYPAEHRPAPGPAEGEAVAFRAGRRDLMEHLVRMYWRECHGIDAGTMPMCMDPEVRSVIDAAVAEDAARARRAAPAEGEAVEFAMECAREAHMLGRIYNKQGEQEKPAEVERKLREFCERTFAARAQGAAVSKDEAEMTGEDADFYDRLVDHIKPREDEIARLESALAAAEAERDRRADMTPAEVEEILKSHTWEQERADEFERLNTDLEGRYHQLQSRLAAAVRALRSVPFGHEHFDPTGRSGRGCDACERFREWDREERQPALAADADGEGKNAAR